MDLLSQRAVMVVTDPLPAAGIAERTARFAERAGCHVVAVDSHGVATFLDELLTWRERSPNFCMRNRKFGTLHALPPRIHDTMRPHVKDRREVIYSLDQPEQQVGARRSRPIELREDPVVLRHVRPAMGGAPGVGNDPVDVDSARVQEVRREGIRAAVAGDERGAGGARCAGQRIVGGRNGAMTRSGRDAADCSPS